MNGIRLDGVRRALAKHVRTSCLSLPNPQTPPSEDEAVGPSAALPAAPAKELTRIPAPPAAAAPAAPTPPEKTAAEDMPATALDDAQRLVKAGTQSIDVNTRGTRAPDIEAEGLRQTAGGTALTMYNVNVALGQAGQAPSVSVDRQMVLANQTLHLNGSEVAAYGGLAGGVYLAGANVKQSEEASTNLFILGDPHFLAPGAVQKFHVEGLPITLGVCGWAAGGTTLKALQRQNDWIKIEQARKRSGGAMLMGGMSNGTVGVGGRLVVTRDKEIILRRWTKPETAAELLKTQDQGLRTYARNKAIALGLAEPPLHYPNLAEPKTFEMHDELICTVKGSVTGSIALATSVVLSGLHYTRSGEFELTVNRRKNADTGFADTLTVVISPKKGSSGVSGSMDLPILGELHRAVSHADATRLGYDFLTDEPEAMKAYRRLLEGELPGAALEVTQTPALDAPALSSLLQKETLPKGVKRVFAERATLPKATSLGGGFTLTRYLPGLKWAGLAAEKRTRHSRHTIADTAAAVSTEAQTIETDTETICGGTHSKKVFVQAQQVMLAEDGAVHDRGITLGAKLAVDRTRGSNRNGMVRALNDEVLITPRAKAFHTKGKLQQTYDVSVERKLDPRDLSRLRDLRGAKNLQAEASQPLRQLLTELAQAGEAISRDPAVASAVFGRFVGKRGLKGLGELHRLLGDDARLSVKPASSAKEDVAKEVLELTVKYHRPLSPRAQAKRELNKRVRQVSKAVEHAERATEDVRSDPLLRTFDPEALEEQVKSLETDRGVLKDLLNTAHLDAAERQALASKLTGKAKKALQAVRGADALAPSTQENRS